MTIFKNLEISIRSMKPNTQYNFSLLYLMKFWTQLLWPEGLKPAPVERGGRGFNLINKICKRFINLNSPQMERNVFIICGKNV
jgi:hypothetical protein